MPPSSTSLFSPLSNFSLPLVVVATPSSCSASDGLAPGVVLHLDDGTEAALLERPRRLIVCRASERWGRLAQRGICEAALGGLVQRRCGWACGGDRGFSPWVKYKRR